MFSMRQTRISASMHDKLQVRQRRTAELPAAAFSAWAILGNARRLQSSITGQPISAVLQNVWVILGWLIVLIFGTCLYLLMGSIRQAAALQNFFGYDGPCHSACCSWQSASRICTIKSGFLSQHKILSTSIVTRQASFVKTNQVQVVTL